MSEQKSLNITGDNKVDSVEKYKFDPIKGYPMLHWNGKRPFTSTQFYPAQKKEVYGEEVDGWLNKIFWGDNLQVMSHLLKKYRGKVDLIYIDPPFDSKADYKKNINLKGKRISSDTTSFEEKQYTDIWSNDDYLQFIYERLILIRELLSESGSIYVHCDYHQGHFIRCIMDEIFGNGGDDLKGPGYKNQIVWKRTSAHSNSKQGAQYYGRQHDLIFYYTKSSDYTWNQQFTEYDESYIEQNYRMKEDDGRRFQPVDLTAAKPGGDTNYEWKGYKLKSGRYWAYSREKMKKFDEDGRLYYTSSGMPRLKYYLDEMPGVPLQDMWTDMKNISSQSNERLDYPTQKPEALLERIILNSSNSGDLIFDCFMGSGTAQSVAMKLGRRFIGADINLGAIQTTTKRLNKYISDLGEGVLEHEEQIKHPGFEVYNVNNYDVFRNPIEAKILLLEALEIEAISGSTYDGEKDGYMVKIMPVNRIATREDLNELIANFPYKVFEQRKEENPNKPVESISLICMGHEPDLKAHLEQECGYKLDVEVIDILRDKSHIEFKRDAEAEIKVENSKVRIINFFPMNLMQKLSLQKESVSEWCELVDSIVIDWNYGGAAMEPTIIDIPEKEEFVEGVYDIPEDAGTIKIKITDLLSESYEEVIKYG